MHAANANGHPPQPPVRPCQRRLTGLWRYDPARGAWEKLALPAGGAAAVELAGVQVRFRADRPVVADPASRSSLYWVEWREDGRRAGATIESTPGGHYAPKAARPPDGSAATCVPCTAATPAPFVPRSAPSRRFPACPPPPRA